MPPTETLEQVQKAGRERLYPSITNPNWLVLRKRRELFRHWLESSLPEDAAVLDIGGRVQPYRALLPGARYLALDIRATPLVDVIAVRNRFRFAIRDLTWSCALKCWNMRPTRAVCSPRFTACSSLVAGCC